MRSIVFLATLVAFLAIQWIEGCDREPLAARIASGVVMCSNITKRTTISGGSPHDKAQGLGLGKLDPFDIRSL